MRLDQRRSRLLARPSTSSCPGVPHAALSQSPPLPPSRILIRNAERELCVQELTWAIEAGKAIVPVVVADDKKLVTNYITEGKGKGIDLSACDFKHVDRSNTTMMQAPSRM